jgi:HPt (histidine-containing phosphotransfer) domain-containing protein
MQEQNHLVNLSQIDQISSGDPTFRNEMIGIFTGQIPVFLENIDKFWNENDLENLAKEVHTAKSSVLIFGMEETGHNLKEIQLFAENDEVDKIEELLMKVVKDLNDALTYLTTILKG